VGGAVGGTVGILPPADAGAVVVRDVHTFRALRYGAGTAAHLQAGRESGRACGVGVVVDHGVQLPPGVSAELGLRHRDRRQRGCGVAGQFDVVETGHRDVGGHGDAGLVQACEQAERDQVVEGHRGGGASRQYGGGGGVAGLDVRPGGQVEDLQVRVLPPGAGEAGAAQLVGGAPHGSAEVDDAAVAERHEVLHDL
jgi:hypothetical protein